MWFVKDFADGWIAFDNEAAALREVAETGAVMLVATIVPSPALEAVARPVEFPYQRTFDAISAAVTLGARGITSVNISVKAFQDAWNDATATEGE